MNYPQPVATLVAVNGQPDGDYLAPFTGAPACGGETHLSAWQAADLLDRGYRGAHQWEPGAPEPDAATLAATANAQAQYETINAYWELSVFFVSANDPSAFADLSRAARQILSDVAGVESFDDLSRDTEETVMDAARNEALSVCVRSGWTVLGEPLTADEFEILLSTGGPACRIVGDLRDGEPCRAEIQWQDWGTPWTRLAGQSCDALDWFAGLFYFGG